MGVHKSKNISTQNNKENNLKGTTIDILLENYEKKEGKIVKSELFTGHKPIPLKIPNKVMKSICKITIKTKIGISFKTGFFLKYSDSKKYLITNYHIINQYLENENI